MYVGITVKEKREGETPRLYRSSSIPWLLLEFSRRFPMELGQLRDFQSKSLKYIYKNDTSSRLFIRGILKYLHISCQQTLSVSGIPQIFQSLRFQYLFGYCSCNYCRWRSTYPSEDTVVRACLVKQALLMYIFTHDLPEAASFFGSSLGFFFVVWMQSTAIHWKQSKWHSSHNTLRWMRWFSTPQSRCVAFFINSRAAVLVDKTR